MAIVKALSHPGHRLAIKTACMHGCPSQQHVCISSYKYFYLFLLSNHNCQVYIDEPAGYL